MRYLTFDVDKQQLIPTSDNSGIVLGTKGYLGIQVKFNDVDWNGCKVVCRFSYGSFEDCVPLQNGSCKVPDTVAGLKDFKIDLVGRSDGYQILTNKVTINQTE